MPTTPCERVRAGREDRAHAGPVALALALELLEGLELRLAGGVGEPQVAEGRLRPLARRLARLALPLHLAPLRLEQRELLAGGLAPLLHAEAPGGHRVRLGLGLRGIGGEPREGAVAVEPALPELALLAGQLGAAAGRRHLLEAEHLEPGAPGVDLETGRGRPLLEIGEARDPVRVALPAFSQAADLLLALGASAMRRSPMAAISPPSRPSSSSSSRICTTICSRRSMSRSASPWIFCDELAEVGEPELALLDRGALDRLAGGQTGLLHHALRLARSAAAPSRRRAPRAWPTGRRSPPRASPGRGPASPGAAPCTAGPSEPGARASRAGAAPRP